MIPHHTSNYATPFYLEISMNQTRFPVRTAAGARAQRGMTLIVSLVMLIMLTMFAISTMNLSNSNLKVVGNQQALRAVEAAAQQALEQVLSGSTVFQSPVTQTLTIDGFAVAVTAPVCIRSQIASGSSKDFGITNIPEMDLFEVVASTSDSISGATASLRQGVDLMMLQGYCT